jgi:hypothetical protein
LSQGPPSSRFSTAAAPERISTIARLRDRGVNDALLDVRLRVDPNQQIGNGYGVNKSGLYSEFKDKEDLFMQSLRYYLESLERRRDC